MNPTLAPAPAGTDGASAARPTVWVRGLRIAGVPSDAAIVEQVDLELRPGEVVGLVGESGSGKTTLGLALLAYYNRGPGVRPATSWSAASTSVRCLSGRYAGCAVAGSRTSRSRPRRR